MTNEPFMRRQIAEVEDRSSFALGPLDTYSLLISAYSPYTVSGFQGSTLKRATARAP